MDNIISSNKPSIKNKASNASGNLSPIWLINLDLKNAMISQPEISLLESIYPIRDLKFQSLPKNLFKEEVSSVKDWLI
jgi:hypothetical protein